MNKKTISNIRVAGITAALFLPAFFAGAQAINNPLAYNTIQDAINAILGVIIDLAAVILIVFFVYAGFMFVAAQGDPGKLEKARNAFFYTVIGAAILLGAKALSVLIQNTLAPIINK